MRRGGFTLLEVVLAMVILAIFATVCLQMRLEGLRAGRAVADSQRVERLLADVLELARAQLLPQPRIERTDAGEVVRIVWDGEREGVAYTCVEDEAAVPAPTLGGASVVGSAGAVARLRRLTARAAGQRAVLYLPLRRRP